MIAARTGELAAISLMSVFTIERPTATAVVRLPLLDTAEERFAMPDRAAIVTGASRGIGFALAEVLGDEGHQLTVTARKPESLEQAADQLRSEGFTVEHVAANLADEDAIR